MTAQRGQCLVSLEIVSPDSYLMRTGLEPQFLQEHNNKSNDLNHQDRPQPEPSRGHVFIQPTWDHNLDHCISGLRFLRLVQTREPRVGRNYKSNVVWNERVSRGSNEMVYRHIEIERDGISAITQLVLWRSPMGRLYEDGEQDLVTVWLDNLNEGRQATGLYLGLKRETKINLRARQQRRGREDMAYEEAMGRGSIMGASARDVETLVSMSESVKT